MKRILFPTEFSNHAPEVFRYAVELAYFFKAHLVVLHAFNEPEEKLHTEKELEKMADEISSRLIKFITDHLPESHQKIGITIQTKSGFASDAILEVGLDENIDLIVMGMTGKINAIDTLMGTTSLEVLNKADCPVLLIPAESHFKGIDNLVYTTNFEFRDLEAIQYLKRWSKAFEATIHCFHIAESEGYELSAVRNMMILKAMYKRHQRILFDMRTGNFQQEIETFAKSKQADIVAMMVHKRSFLSRWIGKSEVKGIARRIQIPLLVIKDNAYELEKDISKWFEVVNSIA